MLLKLLFFVVLVQLISADIRTSRQNGLNSHNQFRSRHSARPLQLDDSIHSFSQNYAQYLARYAKFEHNNGASQKNYGENLYRACSYPNPPNLDNAVVAATTSWYNEIKNYDFNRPGFSGHRGVVGHFTQVVWKSSQRVGFGVAVGDLNQSGRNFKCVYVVANYYPPGNYQGQFAQNVTPN